jgi:hypothetical protein
MGARPMDNFFSSTRNTFQFSMPPSVLAAHQNDYVYAMVPNWDGDAAVALTQQVVNLAGQLVERYGTTENLTQITPGVDGSLSFVWEDRRGNYVYLDVGPGDTVHLYHDIIGNPTWEAVSVASDPRIIAQLAKVFRTVGWGYQLVVAFYPPTRSSTRASIVRTA